MMPPTPSWPSTPGPAAPKPGLGPDALPDVHPLEAERHGFTYKVMDYQEGDEAGLKSAIMIEGENAYGYLQGEHGVHRLVRVFSADANARRQTSFASVEVMPDLPDDVEVEIRRGHPEMQVYRASGAQRGT